MALILAILFLAIGLLCNFFIDPGLVVSFSIFMTLSVLAWYLNRINKWFESLDDKTSNLYGGAWLGFQISQVIYWFLA